MALKNTVAAERRLDLASLFCMIGRHGPAVALAVIALVSVLAGFIIYRTVRGKRRRAAAGDGETSSGGDEGDASAIHPGPEDRSGESTDVTEVADVVQSELRVRLRPAAAAAQKKPPPRSPLNIFKPENEASASKEVTPPEEANRSGRPAAEMEGDGVQDDVSCLKKSVHDEKVLTAECQEEEEDVTDVSDKKTRNEEENTRWSLNKQTPPVGEIGDRWKDNKTTLEMNTEEPPVVVQEVSAPRSCHDNHEEFDEEAFVDQQEAAMPAVRDEGEGLVAENIKKVEDKEENGPERDGEDAGKNHDGSSVSTPPKVDDPDLPGVTADAFTEDFHHQDKMDEDADATIHETGNLPEEHDDPHAPSRCDQSVLVRDSEGSNMASVAADPDTTENDGEKSHPSPPSTLLTSEEMSHSDMLSSSQEQEDSGAGAAPVTTKDASLPLGKIHSPCSEARGDGVLSPGEESGISSLAVSPDLQDDGGEFGVGDQRFEAQNSLFADDAALSGGNEDAAEMLLGHYSSLHFQSFHSERSDWTQYNYFAANEDMFGHEIEDGYHRAVDQFAAQLAVSVTSFTDGMKTQTDVNAVVEVVEIKERAGVSAEKKGDEEEKQEDYERTEISIMEATMDNNEWITDSFPVLPWLSNLVQHHVRTSQLPPEEGAAVTEPASDVPPPTEIKETSSLSLADENAENNKKVVAVQPMPQNVNVTFCIHYFTRSPHQTVAITGNQQELGNWKGFIPLESAKDGHWSTVVSLPAESHVEWKFVVLDRGEVCRWEECGNRHLDTGYGDDLLVHKWWGLL